MALAEVSTILAHEIRNPLASMELFAGLIAEDPEQTAQWVSNLRAGIRLLSGTVNNVLSIHCGSNSQLAPTDLTACMQSGVEFVQPIAEQAGVSLTFLAAEDSTDDSGQRERTPPDHPEPGVQCHSPHTGGRQDYGVDPGSIARRGRCARW